MRILVTGSRGYLGSHLFDYLNAHFPDALVLGASRHSQCKGELSYRFDQFSSVRNLLASARPDVIFHCVGTTLPGPWDVLMRAHLQPTLQLLEAVRSASGKKPRVVILGSAAEYGPGHARSRFSERVDPRPETLYGVSKFLQTTIALDYAKMGVPVIVARLFNLLAADAPDTFAVSRVVKLLRDIPAGTKGRVRVGPQESVRDFISLKDALHALSLLGTQGKLGEIYNVCSGKGTRMGDLFQAIAEGAKVNVRWVSDCRGSLRSLSSFSVGNCAKIRRHTGWAPQASALDWARALFSEIL